MLKKIWDKYNSSPVQVRASACFFVCSFMQKAISTITTPIFTRLMDSAEYGKFNVFVSWRGICTVFIILYLPWGVFEQGYIKFDDKERDRFASSLVGLMTAMAAIWTVLFLIFQEPLCKLFSLSLVQILAMIVLIWTGSVFSFWSIQQRVQYQYKSLVILTIIASILESFFGIILVAHAQEKVMARILGSAVVDLVLYGWLFLKQISVDRTFYSFKYWKYALEFNIPLIPHYLSQTILNSSDRIMIEKMVDSKSAGIYSLAYSISLIMILLNNALSNTITPWLMQKIKCGKEEDVKKAAYPALAIVALVNLFVIAVAPEIVKIFAPSEYYEAIWVIPPVTLSVYFMFAYGLFANIEFYFEKTKLMSLATVLGAAANVGLNYIFMKKFGYYAAGYTTLFCYVLYAMLHFLFSTKICEKKCGKRIYELKVIVIISGLFIAAGFALAITYNNTLIRYFFIVSGIAVLIKMRFRIIGVIGTFVNLKRKD